MRSLKMIGSISAVFLLCMLPFISVPANGEDVIPVGEPLHLHFRRQTVQDITYLFFHPPDQVYKNISKSDLTYRKTLFARGTGMDSEVIYFPQDPKSNFLQFEPNASIPLFYSFNISAVKPFDLSDIVYILNVKIEIDYQRDGSYDDVISFDITGEAKSHTESKNGTVPVDFSKLKKFNEQKGGRLRINLSRKDYVDTSLTIYCGYNGVFSHIDLPFSKYKYSTDEPDNDKVIWPWVVGIGVLMIIAAVVFFYFKQKQVVQPAPEINKRKGTRRRK